jgi:hypothetical protein
MKKHGRIAAWATAGIVGLCLFARTAAGATEGSWPIAVAIAPSFEAPGADQDVVGLRLNLLAARHRNVAFLDIGTLAGMVTREAYGVQVVGLWNSTGSARGALQAAGFVNLCYGDCYGAQTAGVHSRTEGTFMGLQLAAVCSANVLKGLQVGLFNRTSNSSGVQVGVVNYAEQSEGIQLGLVNIMPDGRYPVMPVFNLGF